MAITHVGSNVPGGNPTTSFTVTINANTLTDDIVILSCTNRGATANPTVTDDDTGGNTWTLLQSTNNGTGGGTVWWKRATSGTASKTVTASGFTNSCSGVCTVYRGVTLAATPYENNAGEANASADETHAAITPTRNGSMVCLSVMNLGNDNAVTSPSTTSPGALATRGEKLSTGGLDCACIHASEVQSTAGTTGSFTWAQTDGATISIVFDLLVSPTLALAQGSYTLTGQSQNLTAQRTLALAQGSYTLNGQDLTLTQGGGDPVIPIGQGSYAYTGQAVLLNHGYVVTIAQGSYTLTGQAQNFNRGLVFQLAQGSYSLTGQSVILSWSGEEPAVLYDDFIGPGMWMGVGAKQHVIR